MLGRALLALPCAISLGSDLPHDSWPVTTVHVPETLCTGTEGVDCVGNDLHVQSVADAGSCCAACTNFVAGSLPCTGWKWDSSDRQCFLKSSCSSSISASATSVVGLTRHRFRGNQPRVQCLASPCSEIAGVANKLLAARRNRHHRRRHLEAAGRLPRSSAVAVSRYASELRPRKRVTVARCGRAQTIFSNQPSPHRCIS